MGRYRRGTLVLETEFHTETGSAVVTDFMRPTEGAADLVRIVTGCSGSVAFTTELVMRFNYGATTPWVSRREDGRLDAIAGPEPLVLRSPVDLRGENRQTVGEFAIKAGQSVRLCRAYLPSVDPPPPV